MIIFYQTCLERLYQNRSANAITSLSKTEGANSLGFVNGPVHGLPFVITNNKKGNISHLRSLLHIVRQCNGLGTSSTQ